MKQFSLAFAMMGLLVMGISFCAHSQIKARSSRDVLFDVKVNDDSRAVLSWVSSEGHRPARFIVQRSKDNDTFFDIREIPVKENMADERLQFTFTDSKILRYSEYYRIVEYEQDGQFNVYTSIAAKITSPIIVARQNDRNVITVTVENNTNVTALVGTESGLGIPCEQEATTDANSVVLKSLYPLNSGSYVVKLRSPGGERQFKFTVKSDERMISD
ncbi:hypothetical protein [Flectobacillus roseus]|uniref:hypothetical protein n=1 Tax=Flectobacillus roseus TaxID=502259 RepID=UPI0024B7579E|nr:hypothetical protein [Flectobacillus roseus]MDI9869150.1 hypothetical protein [Flectobacillus roseus]